MNYIIISNDLYFNIKDEETKNTLVENNLIGKKLWLINDFIDKDLKIYRVIISLNYPIQGFNNKVFSLLLNENTFKLCKYNPRRVKQ